MMPSSSCLAGSGRPAHRSAFAGASAGSLCLGAVLALALLLACATAQAERADRKRVMERERIKAKRERARAQTVVSTAMSGAQAANEVAG